MLRSRLYIGLFALVLDPLRLLDRQMDTEEGISSIVEDEVSSDVQWDSRGG